MQSNDFNVAGQFGDLCWNTDFTDTFQIMQIQWNSGRQVPLMKDHPSLLSCLFRQLFLHISIWMNSSSSSTSTHSTRVYRGIAGDKKQQHESYEQARETKKKRRGQKVDRDNYGELTPLWWRRQCEGAMTVSWGRWLKSLLVVGKKAGRSEFCPVCVLTVTRVMATAGSGLWSVLKHPSCMQDFCSFFFFFFAVFLVLHCPYWEIQVALPGQGTAAAGAALPIPISACCTFVCPNNAMAASAWDFLTCARMLMHVIAHGGCTGIVRVCAGGWLLEKTPLPHQGFEPASVLWLSFQFRQMLFQLSYPAPVFVSVKGQS